MSGFPDRPREHRLCSLVDEDVAAEVLVVDDAAEVLFAQELPWRVVLVRR